MGHFLSARPIVKTLEGEFIDLEKQKGIAIVNILEED